MLFFPIKLSGKKYNGIYKKWFRVLLLYQNNKNQFNRYQIKRNTLYIGKVLSQVMHS